MKKKINRNKRIPVMGRENPEMDITKFRKDWIKKGYNLVDITQLCDFKLGISGYCNDFNLPDEQIYHIKIMYRDECIGTFEPSSKQDNMFERFEMFVTDESFIVFIKLRIEKEPQQEVVGDKIEEEIRPTHTIKIKLLKNFKKNMIFNNPMYFMSDKFVKDNIKEILDDIKK